MNGFRFRGDHAFNLAVLAVYLAILSFVLWRHLFWLDEVQAWLIARDSVSIPDLIHNLRFEGHPALWYLLLMVPAHLGFGAGSLLWMQAAIALCTIGIILWFAPLNRLEKAILPFGAVPLFVHGAIARSYMLGFLLVVLICVLWPRRYERPLVLAVLLALLANLHVLFMICALAFALAYLASRPVGYKTTGREGIALLVFCAGFAASITVGLPAEGYGYATEWHTSFSVDRLKQTVAELSGLFGSYGGASVGLMAFGIITFILSVLRKDRAAFVFLATASAGLFAFFYMKYSGWIWHHALYFVCLLAAVWIGRAGSAVLPRSANIAFLGVLVVNLIPAAGELKYVLEQRPPSYAAAAAELIAEKGWESQPIIGSPYTTTVLGYLPAKRIYYLGAQRWNSFMLLDRAHFRPYDLDQAVEQAVAAVGTPATLLLHISAIAPDLAKHGFKTVAVFDNPPARLEQSLAVYRREAAAN